jgi:hypothetical protein
MKRDYLGLLHHCLGIAYYVPHLLVPAGLVGLVAPAFIRSPILAAAIGAVAGAAVTGSVAAWVSLRLKQRHFQNPQLDIIRSEATYTVGIPPHFTFEHALTVRARVAGVHGFRSRFKWTGLASVRTTVSPSSVGVVALGAGDGIWEGFEVTFARPLMKGEQASFTVRLEMTNTSYQPLPLLKKLIDDNFPYGITMRVAWDHPPKKISRQIFGSIRAIVPLSSKTVDTKGNSHTWRLRIVRPYQAYQIGWDDLTGIPEGVPTTMPAD